MSAVSAAFEPGSFRDPDGRVFLTDEGVYRALSEAGLADWRALADSPLLNELSSEGLLVKTELAGETEIAAAIAEALPAEPAAVLRHERIPFVTYPYEWPFSMLRDAALLQLDLLQRALDQGLMLKDASPYNVQWRGVNPVFIDVSSFERLREGEPWAGYRQFCMLFLYPLMLQAYRGIDFQPLLRGAIDGIPPSQARALFGGRDALRAGVLSHIRLHARLERSNAQRAGEDVRGELKSANFSTELIRSNLKRMRKLVERLEWKAGRTAWTAYRSENTYSDADDQAKAAFVAAAVESHSRLTWDLGCNDGAYARLAAEHADCVVALDSDHATVDGLYRALRESASRRIVPLVGNLVDPSPGLGWRGEERRPLAARGAPELVLALALVHHLSISGNVPLRALLDWFASLGARLVIEFATREDPMVKRLLAAKRQGLHGDYELGEFDRLLSERFSVERRETLPSQTRVLFLARPR
ncbi:MAG: methyltransferase [Solirubrobacterales bacterium]